MDVLVEVEGDLGTAYQEMLEEKARGLRAGMANWAGETVR